MIVGLDHIQLAMPPGKEEKAREFYSGVLGISEVEKPASLVSRGGCWFQSENVVIHLGVQADFVPATKAHPAFLVRGLEKFRSQLEDFGIAVERDTSLANTYRCYIRDPFGNRIELIEETDGFSRT